VSFCEFNVAENIHVCYFVLSIHWYKVSMLEQGSNEGAVLKFDAGIYRDRNYSCKYKGI
jgi:hypothetical protein